MDSDRGHGAGRSAGLGCPGALPAGRELICLILAS